MKRWMLRALAAVVAVAGAAGTGTAGIIVDGQLGVGEYAGVTPKGVDYDPAAPNGNFGTPGTNNSGAGYTIRFTSDATNVYGLLRADRDVSASSLLFSNLYFSTTPPGGSNVGFELQNSRAFVPGGSGYFPYTSASGIQLASLAQDSRGFSAIEFAIPWSFFTNDPLGIGFTKISASNPNLQLRLSQSFGYSVAGGPDYGNDRLGVVTLAAVPEPSGLALMGLSLTGLVPLRRRLFGA